MELAIGMNEIRVYRKHRCLLYTLRLFYGFLYSRLRDFLCDGLWFPLIRDQFFCKASIRGGVKLSKVVRHLTIRHRILKSFCKVCSFLKAIGYYLSGPYLLLRNATKIRWNKHCLQNVVPYANMTLLAQ